MPQRIPADEPLFIYERIPDATTGDVAFIVRDRDNASAWVQSDYIVPVRT